MSTVDGGRLTVDGEERGQRLRVCVEKLCGVLTLEQLEQLAEVLTMTYDLAVLRETEQSVTILLNDKGYPRGLNASYNVRVVKPRTYNSE